jgi:hypothetical protein
MLKQNLTKVIAVATIAAAGVFVSGCSEEVESKAPLEEGGMGAEEGKEGGENSDAPPEGAEEQGKK